MQEIKFNVILNYIDFVKINRFNLNKSMLNKGIVLFEILMAIFATYILFLKNYKYAFFLYLTCIIFFLAELIFPYIMSKIAYKKNVKIQYRMENNILWIIDKFINKKEKIDLDKAYMIFENKKYFYIYKTKDLVYVMPKRCISNDIVNSMRDLFINEYSSKFYIKY